MINGMEQRDRLLTVQELADYLGVPGQKRRSSEPHLALSGARRGREGWST